MRNQGAGQVCTEMKLSLQFRTSRSVIKLALMIATALITGSAVVRAVDFEGLESIPINPGDSIQAAVDANPEVTTFILKAGIHREQHIIPKSGNTFIGELGGNGERLTILSGAKVLPSEDFVKNVTNGWWKVVGQTQTVSSIDISSRCDKIKDIDFLNTDGAASYTHPDPTSINKYLACDLSQDLFIDDNVLWQVLSTAELASGTWFFDRATNEIFIKDDPTGKSVEISTTRHAFETVWPATDPGRANVTIKNLIIERYAPRSQEGAIQPWRTNNTSPGWVIENNEFRFNHGYGLRINDAMTIRDNYIHHNGQLGLGGSGKGLVVVERNEIAFNNVRGYSRGFEAGGSKFVGTDNLVVRNNYVHHNYGPGLWTDVDNVNVLYEDNLIVWNERQGISHEISYSAIIRNNDVRFNGLKKDVWMWGAQILIQNSSDVEVHNNYVVIDQNGGDGIGIINQNRGEGAYGPRVSQDNYVHDNEIIFLAERGSTGTVDDTSSKTACTSSSNNRFDHNTYHVPSLTHKRWVWCSNLDWNGFRSKGQEANGKIDTSIPSGANTVPQ